MKTIQQLFVFLFTDPKDEPIFNYDHRVKSSRPFHPAPSYWALIPLRIEEIKRPQQGNQE